MSTRALLLAILAAAGAARAAGPAEGPVPLDVRLSIGGGVSGFVDGTVRGMADFGGAWDVRLTTRSRSWFGQEFAYAGTVRRFVAPMLADGGERTMLTHALEFSARFNRPWMTPEWMLEPFACLGIGWTHLQLDRMPQGSPVRASDDVFVGPAAAGVSFVYGDFLVEGRFTDRQSFGEHLVVRPDGSTASLSSWSATLALGYEF